MSTAYALAAASGHGGTDPMVYVVVPFMVVIFILSIYRMRRGGPGPGVGWVPKRFRSQLNGMYRAGGWQGPYDDRGNRSSSQKGL